MSARPWPTFPNRKGAILSCDNTGLFGLVDGSAAWHLNRTILELTFGRLSNVFKIYLRSQLLVISGMFYEPRSSVGFAGATLGPAKKFDLNGLGSGTREIVTLVVDRRRTTGSWSRRCGTCSGLASPGAISRPDSVRGVPFTRGALLIAQTYLYPLAQRQSPSRSNLISQIRPNRRGGLIVRVQPQTDLVLGHRGVRPRQHSHPTPLSKAQAPRRFENIP